MSARELAFRRGYANGFAAALSAIRDGENLDHLYDHLYDRLIPWWRFKIDGHLPPPIGTSTTRSNRT